MDIENEETALELWKWALHEDTLFVSRSLLCVAVQALLFAGLDATYKNYVLPYIFILTGAGMSVLWLVAMQHQYVDTLNRIKRDLRAYGKVHPGTIFAIYSTMAHERDNTIVPSLNQIFARVLPSLFLLAWIAALALYWIVVPS
jgi:hypothetical protein